MRSGGFLLFTRFRSLWFASWYFGRSREDGSGDRRFCGPLGLSGSCCPRRSVLLVPVSLAGVFLTPLPIPEMERSWGTFERTWDEARRCCGR